MPELRYSLFLQQCYQGFSPSGIGCFVIVWKYCNISRKLWSPSFGHCSHKTVWPEYLTI